MNGKLAQKIHNTRVGHGELAVFWIGQAGFVYKTHTNKVIYVDAFMSNCVNRMLSNQQYGFKRIMITPIEPEEVEADVVVCTHSHPDHFDYDAIPIFATNPRVRFVGAPDCRIEFEKLSVPPAKYTIMEEGEHLDCGDFKLTGIHADHGELAPDAMGVVIEVGDIRIWQVGDSAYCPNMWHDVFQLGIDVILPPINGTFGNLDEVQAAKLANDARAKVAIPCHYWMFAEHGGNPARFMDACKAYAPEVKPVLLSQAELFVYRKQRDLVTGQASSEVGSL